MERVLAAPADRTLAATLQSAIEAAQRRVERLMALSRAFIDKLTGKATPEPSTPVIDRIDQLADWQSRCGL